MKDKDVNYEARLKFKKKMKHCRYCKTTENLTLDHKIAVINGGADVETNWQCLCYPCNSAKSAMSHRQVMNLFKWFLRIQESREKLGKKHYMTKKVEIKN